ncbi:MAG: oligoendopeptidase F, partial [Spirochaetales bacterium]|nr:oligoendopeptidase F [Spirochaetales bacterium]
DLLTFSAGIPRLESFRGSLGTSAEALKNCLDATTESERLSERLGYYAHLRLSEDGGNNTAQDRFARYMSVASKMEAAASYQRSEIMAIPKERMDAFLAEDILSEYIIPLRKIIRFRPHILSEKEEHLLALQSEANQTAQKTYSALTDVDLDFGTLKTKEGEKPLSQASFASFMLHPDRALRQEAYTQFYTAFEKHKNTLSSLLAGSVHLDIYHARARNYPSARAAALFPDKVPEGVYDNLISAVHDRLEAVHGYYRLRKELLHLDTLRHYDVYVPLVKDVQVKHTWDEAVETILEALQPLGSEYTDTLSRGLRGRWADRYENKGKRSGAFSAGSYDGDPYILINYKEDVLRDVFTLAHEGGHSMHSWYSVRYNPFQYYQYSIFEAEVASTFNEQLLAAHLLKKADSPSLKAYIIGKQVDDIIATLIRQTMFAEFEKKIHETTEQGGALTVEFLRKTYRSLLETYFGPAMVFEDLSDLEALRIPHFYRAFYVYKYATGLSAAVTLADEVLQGSKAERDRYLSFLSSGGSHYPLEALRKAGVDMERPEPIYKTLDRFADMVKNLEGLLKVTEE